MNICFILNNLANSELSFDLISTINKHSENSNVIFYKNILPPVIEPQCLVTNLSCLPSAKGTVVAFDLDSAKALDSAGITTRNVFYACDLEWFYAPVNFLVAQELLSKFEVYAPSEKYRQILQNYLNKPVTVCKSIERFYECLTMKL